LPSTQKINIDDTKRKAVYVCKGTNHVAHAHAHALGSDGNLASAGGAHGHEAGVFVKGTASFDVSLILSVSEKFGVRDPY
jgi:hypothetical protein